MPTCPPRCQIAIKATRRKANEAALFLREDEIERRLGLAKGEWPPIATVLERHGLPRIDPLLGGRYWPAVRFFFDRRYGISNVEVSQPDGEEDLDALR
jgi:hypothetical protein